MSSSERFCLKWNEFEKNISLSLREFKEEEDFYDVTIAVEDKQVEAHKIIISACSPFFKNVLKMHHHTSPLLYLKDVRYKDMVGLLDFMYYGEVNVAQADINTFLAAAEELQIKGLTQKDKRQKIPGEKSERFGSSGRNQNESERETLLIKSEPSLTSYNEQTPDELRGGLEESTDAQIGNIDSYNTSELINDEYQDEQDFTWRVDVSPLWTEAAEQRSEVPCPICGKTFKTRGSLASHKYAYHRDVSNTVHNPPPPPNPIQLLDFQMDTNFESKDRDIECPICHKFFSTKGSLATHKYNYHRNASTLQ